LAYWLTLEACYESISEILNWSFSFYSMSLLANTMVIIYIVVAANVYDIRSEIRQYLHNLSSNNTAQPAAYSGILVLSTLLYSVLLREPHNQVALRNSLRLSTTRYFRITPRPVVVLRYLWDSSCLTHGLVFHQRVCRSMQ